uniref:Beta family protein n=1 Tax=Streptomyces sp. NBC_01401 TaxID=2903854 RepID=A0AAU3H3I7_9ACTN
MVPLASWRTTAVLGGGFPQVADGSMEIGDLHEEPRSDWQMWHEIRSSGRGYGPSLVFGDYGIQPASALAQLPAGGGPPWGVLRYTVENSFVLCKVLTGGPDRTAVVRTAARRIRHLADFRGAAASAGEAWLRDCADGSMADSEGTGSHTQWLRAGSIQHFTYVVRYAWRPA